MVQIQGFLERKPASGHHFSESQDEGSAGSGKCPKPLAGSRRGSLPAAPRRSVASCGRSSRVQVRKLKRTHELSEVTGIAPEGLSAECSPYLEELSPSGQLPLSIKGRSGACLPTEPPTCPPEGWELTASTAAEFRQAPRGPHPNTLLLCAPEPPDVV